MLWTAGIVAVIALLLGAHRISSNDVILLCVIIPSIILHEVSHGWMANLCGDDTAKRAGRLTLNPVAHVDPIGTLILPALMVVSTGFLFGWAKPVPVDVRRLRSPRNQGLLVALAGPATNLVLVAVAAGVFRLAFHDATTVSLGLRIVFYLGFANLILAIYNMIPVPPLDGSALLERALPADWWPRYLQIRQYMLPGLVVVMVLGIYIHVGGTSLVSHLSQVVYNWWLALIGLG
ncbi:MAG TPA: site-2 protease family protein [Acidimicrobiales bacterium]|nr:site-2 protease family protein [Acidimicrobiales bacterium]